MSILVPYTKLLNNIYLRTHTPEFINLYLMASHVGWVEFKAVGNISQGYIATETLAAVEGTYNAITGKVLPISQLYEIDIGLV